MSDLRDAEIAMLKEQNQKLTEMLNFLVNKPGQATQNYQKLLIEQQAKEAQANQSKLGLVAKEN